MKLTGNTILITGGGSGIGRGLAEAFHHRGNKVIITGRRLALLEETVRANPGISYLTLDVTDSAAISQFTVQLLDQYPDVNVLVNNAGIMEPENLLASEVDLNVAENTIATNLLGPIRLSAALLPHLQSKENPAIINVTSGLAFLPLAMTPTYCATKAAIHSYTQSLRYQLRETPVQVIEIAPPYVQTELMGAQQASDPMAMPLHDFISETLELLEENPAIIEVLVDRVKPLRFAEANGGYNEFFIQFNRLIEAAH
ncbi:SDR family NAD(P)-dependent oxidoreductase [Methylomonas paludis]|uniref:SDR family NAD(P)-dependent oxidoreductase n=1 Tax=Methylomonas paludis TaxID=1173101 RepID=A0A975ML40_9GAMM|nr:SDR family NAD(P)-dependent oxidoreductase [Methylomonas paludis]QWF69792.1 SDR family NAD(P)-dependent oxidoreductase [Methylomonas paludis]